MAVIVLTSHRYEPGSLDRQVGMSPCVQYASFLIRLWRQAERQEGIDCDWHSEVEHIQSGNSWLFGSMQELEEFLRQQAIDPRHLDWLEIKENEI